jgi:hypothetical protein
MTLTDWLTGLYLLSAILALSLGGWLWRRCKARQALTSRMLELSMLADVGRSILDAPLDLKLLAEAVYHRGMFYEAWLADASADKTLERLASEVQAFAGSAGLWADVTLALIKRT